MVQKWIISCKGIITLLACNLDRIRMVDCLYYIWWCNKARWLTRLAVILFVGYRFFFMRTRRENWNGHRSLLCAWRRWTWDPTPKNWARVQRMGGLCLLLFFIFNLINILQGIIEINLLLSHLIISMMAGVIKYPSLLFYIYAELY